MALTGATIQTLVGRRTLATDAASLQVYLDILQGVLDDIYSRRKWSWRRKFAEILVPAPYETGTISGSAGGTTITGSGTDFTAISGYTSTEDPFFLEVGNEIHRIESFTDATHLVLKTGLEDAVAAGTTYRIFKAWVDLPSDCAELITLVCHPYGRMRRWSYDHLVRDFVTWKTGTMPVAAALAPVNTSKQQRLVIYPLLTEAKHFHLVYYASAPDISSGSVDLGCPDGFSNVVVLGVLAEWYATLETEGDIAGNLQGLFERKLDILMREDVKLADAGFRSKKPWDVHVTQEFWNVN